MDAVEELPEIFALTSEVHAQSSPGSASKFSCLWEAPGPLAVVRTVSKKQLERYSQLWDVEMSKGLRFLKAGSPGQ